MARSQKRDRIHPDFPLGAWKRKDGTVWYKKVCGVKVTFGGIVNDPTGEVAWAQYDAEKDDLRTANGSRQLMLSRRQQKAWGQEAPPREFAELADRYITKRAVLATLPADHNDKIEPRTFKQSKTALQLAKWLMRAKPIVKYWSIDDWKDLHRKMGLAYHTHIDPDTGRRVFAELPEPKTCSASVKTKRIVYVRSVVQWASVATDEQGAKLLDNLQWGVRGEFFPNVSKRERKRCKYLRAEAAGGKRRLTLEQAVKYLELLDSSARRHASDEGGYRGYRGVATKISALMHRACNYLAANTGTSSADIAELDFDHLDLDAGYVEKLRAKTGTLWQATLWPETVQAIRDYMEVRPKQPARPEWKSLVFITSHGFPVQHEVGTVDLADDREGSKSDCLGREYDRRMRDLHWKHDMLNFGAWRTTFRSLATACGAAWEAQKRIMAQEVAGIDDAYILLEPTELKEVTDAVRARLWPGRDEGPAPIKLPQKGAMVPALRLAV